MRTKPDPFEIRDGYLYLEDVDLHELTQHLDGSAVRLVSQRALGRVIGVADGPLTVAVERGDPPAVLGVLAGAGWWARVISSYELSVARAAGFPAERIVVGGRVKDDNLIKDAISEGVGVLECPEPSERTNAERIADALGLQMPRSSGAPRPMPESGLANCGGLLARVLRPPPELAIDAVWPAFEDAAVFSLLPGEMKAGFLEGLSLPPVPGVEIPVPAWIHGKVLRGDWVVIVPPEGGGNVDRYLDRQKTHPHTPRILVSGSSWRVLEERSPPLPVSPDLHP